MDNTWVTQRVFGYVDPSTSLILNINLEAGVFIEENGAFVNKNFIPARLSFTILDLRSGNEQTKIELSQHELAQLNNKLNKLLTSGKSGHIEVSRYIQKATKKLLVSVYEKTIKLKIVDASTNKELRLTADAMYSIKLLIKNMCEDYLGITTNMMNVCSQNIIMSLLMSSGPSINFGESNNPILPQNQESHPDDASRSSWDIEPNENVICVEDFSTEFSGEKIEETKNKLMEEMGDTPPEKELYNGAFQSMKSLSTGILCVDDNSSEDSFTPLLRIVRDTAPYEDWAMLFGYDYHRKNAYMLKTIKDMVKEYLNSNDIKMGFMPSFRLADRVIPTMSEIWELTIHFASYYLPLNRTCKLLSKLENDLVKRDIQNVEMVKFIIHNITFPLFLSIHPRYFDKFKRDLVSRMEENIRNGIYDDMFKVYSDITGGKIDFGSNIMESVVDNMISKLNEYPILSEDDIRDVPMEVKTAHACKKYIMGTYEYDDDYTPDEIETEVSTSELMTNGGFESEEFDIDAINKMLES